MNPNLSVRARRFVLLAAIWLLPVAATAQTEVLFGTLGADTQFVFAHTSLPGATGINFSFFGAFAGAYPPDEFHTVVIDFEWGPTATGPWTVSPDFINTVPGAMTDLYGTGVFPGPEDAPFVAIHFYAGALITVSGEFTHTSVVPEPQCIAIVGGALVMLACRRCLANRKVALPATSSSETCSG
jgi:hypothetical protein